MKYNKGRADDTNVRRNCYKLIANNTSSVYFESLNSANVVDLLKIDFLLSLIKRLFLTYLCAFKL